MNYFTEILKHIDFYLKHSYNDKIDITFILVTHDIREAVYLSNRLYIMKTNPGAIAKEFNIDLGSKRDQSIKYTTEYIHYVQEVEQSFNSIG